MLDARGSKDRQQWRTCLVCRGVDRCWERKTWDAMQKHAQLLVDKVYAMIGIRQAVVLPDSNNGMVDCEFTEEDYENSECIDADEKRY